MMNKSLRRRDFVKVAGSSLVMGAVASSGRAVAVDEAVATDVAFLSDTHISADKNRQLRGVTMAENLEIVVGQVVDQMPRGAHVIVNGDCAMLKGLRGDYETFAQLMQPIEDAGLRLHVTLGNHDDRAPLYQAMPSQLENDAFVADKHVDVISLPGLDLVLLDSLSEVNVVTGNFGTAQLDWLKGWLAQNSERPVVVVGHHNLQFDRPKEGARYSGASDTVSFAEVLAQHQNVKGYLFGHQHRWGSQTLPERTANGPSLELVNLPAVAYVFDAKQPSGWVHGRFDASALELTLHSIDEKHPSQLETLKLGLG